MFVTTKKSMHFLHLHILPQNPQTHRSFWLRKIFSHGLHGYAQIRRAH